MLLECKVLINNNLNIFYACCLFRVCVVNMEKMNKMEKLKMNAIVRFFWENVVKEHFDIVRSCILGRPEYSFEMAEERKPLKRRILIPESFVQF